MGPGAAQPPERCGVSDGNGDGDRPASEREDRRLLATAGTQARRGSFGPGGGAGIPVERSDQFGATLRRLGDILGRETPRLLGVLVLTVASVVLVVLGPKYLGEATDIIVSGAQEGGIDFGALHRKLAFVGSLYLLSWVLAASQAYILAGVVQRSMYSLRESVEAKLNRLPLAYVDHQPRGDLLSRVTNDIDNLAQSLQLTISQILTSVLTLVGVAIMMITISPVLALVALTTVPVSIWLIRTIGGQGPTPLPRPVAAHGQRQRPGRGGLHRSRGGQELRAPAGGRGPVPRRQRRALPRPASGPSSRRA